MNRPDMSRETDLSVERLLADVRPHTRRVLAQYQIPREDADDLLQETFVALVFKWRSIRNPEAWLLATLRNRCLIYWRQRQEERFDDVDAALLEMLAGSQTPPHQVAELRHDLNAVIARLPAACQRVLRVRYGLGWEGAEAAEQLGCDLSDYRRLTSQCLAHLTRELEQAGFDRKLFGH